jgi:lipoprotein signal peptidase
LNPAHRSHDYGLGLLLSGGVDSVLDRTLRDGRAIDCMNFGIGSLFTDILNVAY